MSAYGVLAGLLCCICCFITFCIGRYKANSAWKRAAIDHEHTHVCSGRIFVVYTDEEFTERDRLSLIRVLDRPSDGHHQHHNGGPYVA